MRFFGVLGLILALSSSAATIQYSATGTGVHVELDGATVKGKINARVAPCAAPGVKMYLDKVFKNVEGGCPYDYGGDNFLIDTAALAEGTHTIEAREGDTVTVRAKAIFTVANVVVPPPPPLPPFTISVAPPRIFNGESGTPLTVNWTASDPLVTCLSDFPGAPTGNPGSATFLFPSPAVTTVVYRIACTRPSNGEVQRYFVTVQGRPPNLQPLPAITPICYPSELGCAFAESADGHVKVWLIEGPTYVVTYRTAYNLAIYPPCVDNYSFTHSNADRQWGRCKAKLSPADEAIAAALETQFEPRFSSVGGPIYIMNLDGTLGVPLTIEGVPSLVDAGVPCQFGQKLDFNGKRYMRVWRAPSATGIVQPFNAFTECARFDAPIGGWAP